MNRYVCRPLEHCNNQINADFLLFLHSFYLQSGAYIVCGVVNALFIIDFDLICVTQLSNQLQTFDSES